MEQIDLTVPVPSSGGTGFWRVEDLDLRYRPADTSKSKIRVGLIGDNNTRLVLGYVGTTAHTLIAQLNVANLSTTSLHKRVLNRLIADGKLAGTVSGSPD